MAKRKHPNTVRALILGAVVVVVGGGAWYGLKYFGIDFSGSEASGNLFCFTPSKIVPSGASIDFVAGTNPPPPPTPSRTPSPRVSVAPGARERETPPVRPVRPTPVPTPVVYSWFAQSGVPSSLKGPPSFSSTFINAGKTSVTRRISVSASGATATCVITVLPVGAPSPTPLPSSPPTYTPFPSSKPPPATHTPFPSATPPSL